MSSTSTRCRARHYAPSARSSCQCRSTTPSPGARRSAPMSSWRAPHTVRSPAERGRRLVPFSKCIRIKVMRPRRPPLTHGVLWKRSVRSGARDVSVMQPRLIRQRPHSTKLSAVILSENWLLEEYHLWLKGHNHLCTARHRPNADARPLHRVELTPRFGQRHPHGRAIRGQWRHNGAAPPPESEQKS